MPEVAVNEHVCQYREPSVNETFSFWPSPKQRETLGNVELIIKVSMTPLPTSEQGVTVTAGKAVIVAIETAGVERKEMGSYLFGEIDVPALETFTSPIEPFDTTRSLQLKSRSIRSSEC